MNCIKRRKRGPKSNVHPKSKMHDEIEKQSEDENEKRSMIELHQQYKVWCATLKVELKQKSKVNVDVRLEKIENIVNEVVISDYHLQRNVFHVDDNDKSGMHKQIEDKIDIWTGVEIDVCRGKQKKTFKEYQATARNWFNRNKAKIYGNWLFYNMIYHLIFKYIVHISTLSDNQKMIIFIDILQRILLEPVQFPRTKLQPLLPHQALMQPNKFKKACERFTLIYNVGWMLGNELNNKRDRVCRYHMSCIHCVYLISWHTKHIYILYIYIVYRTEPKKSIIPSSNV